jgi:predicted phage baseplate assembly protein
VAGNVGENSWWNAVQANPAAPNLFISGVNLAPGAGGAETETLPEAIQRSAASLNDQNRAVTKADFESLAISTEGVAIRRAYAAVGYDPEFPCVKSASAVTVFVVPYAPRVQTDGRVPGGSFVAAPKPDTGALNAVYTKINAGKLLGGQFFVSAPVYRKVWLSLQIAVDFPLSPLMRQSVLDVLQAYLDPLVGGDQGGGWPFGDPVRPSSLLRVAQESLGEAGDVLNVGVSLAGSGNFQICEDTSILPHELVCLVYAKLATQQRTPQGGGLR